MIHTRQDHMFGLLHHLQLDDQIQKLDSTMKSFYTYPGLSPRETKIKFKNLQQQLFVEAITFPANGIPSIETVDELAKRILSSEDYLFLIGCWPEWFELCNQNAYCVAISEKYTGHWCKLQYGLEQILDRSTDLLEHHYRWYQPVSRIEKTPNGFKVTTRGIDGIIYECERLYICCNLRALQEDIELIGCDDITHYVRQGTYQPCMRVHVVLKRDIASSLSQPVLIESLSGPSDKKGGWKCKYSLQISPRVWLISYPDGPLVAEMYEKFLSGELINDWISDMNQYFNLKITRDDIQDIPEVIVWGDAYSILNPSWFEPTAKIGTFHNGAMITSLPKPFDQAWMEGHLYQIPGLFHTLREQFVEIVQKWIVDHGVPLSKGPFRSCTIIPVIKQDESLYTLVGKESTGKRKGQWNPIGGKVLDKYFPDLQGALYACFEELAEEACILIQSIHKLYSSILCVGEVDTQYNIKVLCISIVFDETKERMIQWWNQQRQYRLDQPWLPERWLEFEDIKEINIQDPKDLSYYPLRMIQFVQKYISSINTTIGLNLEDITSIQFNSLALPFVL
jgi:hypothetical protein